MVIFAAVIIICVLIMMYQNMYKYGKTAEIMQNGEVVKTIELMDVNEPYEFDIIAENGGINTVRVENGRIAVVDATCPDKVCVNTGYIDHSGKPIVCLPNKFSIRIVDDGNNIDAAAG